MAALLDIMAKSQNSVSLKQLAEEAQLHTSTTHRILSTLLELGYVERNGSGSYKLGVKLLHLGSKVLHAVDLRNEALPVMRQLRDRVGETVNLVIPENQQAVYVERVSGKHSVRVEHEVGGRLPLHATAAGKLFLAQGGAEACLEYSHVQGLEAKTQRTITDPMHLWKAVKQASEDGFALDEEEVEDGVSCVAAPVFDANGRIVASLSVSSPTDRFSRRWVTQVQDAAGQLSTRLGYSP